MVLSWLHGALDTPWAVVASSLVFTLAVLYADGALVRPRDRTSMRVCACIAAVNAAIASCLCSTSSLSPIAVSSVSMLITAAASVCLARCGRVVTERPDAVSRLGATYFGQMGKGKYFSRMAHGRIMFSFGVNTTRNRVEEGAEIFRGHGVDPKRYAESLERFLAECVHPKDAETLRMNSSARFYKNMLREDPAYSLRFRVSPKKLGGLLDLTSAEAEAAASIDKEWAWVAANCMVVRDDASGDVYLFAYIIDVDTDMRKFEDMKQSASFDALTGVFNRKALEGAIGNALSDDRANGSMVLVDLDNFKQVNDVLGHPAGDKVLQETADILRAEFRSADIIGRLGGDEFMAFSMGLCRDEDIARKLERLVEVGRREVPTPDGGAIKISFSIGASVCPEQGRSYRSLYKRADLALYRSKEMGKDRYTVFDETLEE